MAIFILALSFLPSFAWLLFYIEEDLHPEPKNLILLTFIAGAFSTLVALLLQMLFACGYLAISHTFCGDTSSNNLVTLPIFLILFAGIEEVVKFGAAYLTVHRKAAFDEPVDAMVYMTVAALGFAAIENIGVLHQAQNSALLDSVLTLVSLRFVGATLLHTLTSGLVGYYWAMSIRDFGDRRMILKGLFYATILHATFNYLILMYGNLLYSLVFLSLVGFFILNDFEKLKAEVV